MNAMFHVNTPGITPQDNSRRVGICFLRKCQEKALFGKESGEEFLEYHPHSGLRPATCQNTANCDGAIEFCHIFSGLLHLQTTQVRNDAVVVPNSPFSKEGI